MIFTSGIVAATTIFAVSYISFAFLKEIDGSIKDEKTPLQQAALGGHKIWLKFLLFFGANPNIKNSSDSPFAIAYDKSDFESAKLLIDYGADMRTSPWSDKKEYLSPLIVACRSGHIEIIKKILEKHPDLLTQPTSNGYTPLQLACLANQLAAAQLLIEYGADPYALDFAGSAPFHLAIMKGHLPIVRMILEKAPNKNTVIEQKNAAGCSPLQLACLHGHGDIIQLLVDNGANIRGMNSLHQTVLHAAALANHAELIPVLLKIAPDLLNQKNNDGKTPLYSACKCGSLEAASRLIELGADIHAVNDKGETILHAAAQNPKCTPLIPLILKKAPELLEKLTLDRKTPLYLACEQNCSETARCLISNGATFNFFQAVFDNRLAVLKLLLTLIPHGDKILEQKISGLTPLGCACSKGHAETVKMLLEHGADITALNGPEECTALHLASRFGQTKAIEALLEKAPKLEEETKQRKTALHLACLHGHDPAARLLIAKGADASRVLFDAALAGDIKALQTILEIDPEIVSRFEGAWMTPLYWACTGGHTDAAKLLIQNGSTIGNALCAAASYGQNVTLQLLLDLASDKKSALEQKAGNYTPLGWACYGRHDISARILLENGADPFTALCDAAIHGNMAAILVLFKIIPNKEALLAQKTSDGRTPLYLACTGGHLDIVQLLLDNGANIKEVNHYQHTVLHAAAIGNHPELISMLFKMAPGLLNQKNSIGISPLQAACALGKFEAARRLNDLGADLHAVDINQYTILHSAAGANDVLLISTLLSEVPSLLNQKNISGISPLYCACRLKKFEAACLLIRSGADIYAVDNDNETVLHAAACGDFSELIPMLLRMAPGLLNQKDIKGHTPLHAACGHSSFKAARVLIELGAELSQAALSCLNPIPEEIRLALIERQAKDLKQAEDTLQQLHACYCNAKDLSQIKEIREKALKRHDDLIKIRATYSFFEDERVWIARSEKLRAEYARLAETCGSKMAVLKDPEEEFNEEIVFTLLTQVGLLLPNQVSGIKISTEDMFYSTIGTSLQKVIDKGLEFGEDLRKIGITFTLRYLSERLANERDQVMPAILAELTRIEEVIPQNAPDRNALLEWSARLKQAKFSASELKDFHQDYVIAVLKDFLNR